MSYVILKRGTKADLEKEELKDGLLSFTVDDGKIHLDYTNEEGNVVRKTMYSGKLTIGPHEFDGSEDVTVGYYDGSIE